MVMSFRSFKVAQPYRSWGILEDHICIVPHKAHVRWSTKPVLNKDTAMRFASVTWTKPLYSTLLQMYLTVSQSALRGSDEQSLRSFRFLYSHKAASQWEPRHQKIHTNWKLAA